MKKNIFDQTKFITSPNATNYTCQISPWVIGEGIVVFYNSCVDRSIKDGETIMVKYKREDVNFSRCNEKK